MQPATQDNERIALTDLFTVARLAKEFPDAVTVWALRNQLRNRNSNGLADCCVRQGKRLLIAKSRYEAWLATRTGAA